MSDSNKKILKKIKGLLAIAKDSKGSSDEESQSAFLLAQRLMVENDISKNELIDSIEDVGSIGEESVTVYKKLFWWERELGEIISKNFKVKCFYSHKKTKYKSKIVFYGFGSDLELAKEMYLLAYEVLLFHTKIYIETFYEENGDIYERSRYMTESIKSSYIRGFLSGLNSRFSEQAAVLSKQYDLMVLVPKEVETSYAEYSADFGKISIETPPIKISDAYLTGETQARKVDFTRRTVSTDYQSLVNKYILFDEGITSGLFAKVISVKDDLLNLVVMNVVTNARENGKEIDFTIPSFYGHTLYTDYDFEIITEGHEKICYQEWYEAYLNKDVMKIRNKFKVSEAVFAKKDIDYYSSLLLEEELLARKKLRSV